MTRRTLLGAAVLWVLVDVLRMWTPSLITIFGRAAETPAELIGAFALACGALPLVLVAVLGRARWSAPLALALLAAARLVLFFTDGGQPQLWLGSIGVVAGIWWLAIALGRDRGSIAPTVMGGLALATVTHAALGTYGAVWRKDAWGVLELVVSLGLLVALSRAPASAEDRPTRGNAVTLFAALFVAGVVLLNAGRASAAGGSLGLTSVAVGAVLAVAVTRLPVSRWAFLVAGLVLIVSTFAAARIEVEVGGIVGVSPPWVVWAYVTGPVALGYVLAVSSARTGRGGPGWVAGGAIAWVALLFGYYAGYDLGYRADFLLGWTAVAVCAAAAWPERSGLPEPVRWRRLAGGAATATIVAAGLAVVGPTITIRPLPANDTTATQPVRVAAYNLRMGYGISGRFEATAVAKLLQREHVDVVLLSEIDRGWLLNGGQDQLAILARLLDMHAAFGPAADPVWGDAVLSRGPLSDVHNEAFASYGAVTGAQALVATTDVRGQRLTVISTHLQPGADGTNDTVAQAKDLAALMASQSGPTVMGGDLNTTPSSTAWQEIAATGFTDALARARPLLTSSSDDPTEELDHIWVGRGVVATNPRAIAVSYSDHLPVLVDITTARE